MAIGYSYGDPFEQMQRELERMLDGALDSVATGVYPPVNVFDAGEAVVLKAELPGVKPEQVEVEVHDDTVTIRGERTFDEPAPEGAYHRRERPQGKFRRVVRLPAALESEAAKAEYRDGVLTVTVPKARAARPRRVQVQAS